MGASGRQVCSSDPDECDLGSIYLIWALNPKTSKTLRWEPLVRALLEQGGPKLYRAQGNYE